VRHSLHQIAGFRLQKFVGHYQPPHGLTHVTAAGRNGLIGCDFKPIRFLTLAGLWDRQAWLGICCLFVPVVNMFSYEIRYGPVLTLGGLS
jgi:hypothetical protein